MNGLSDKRIWVYYQNLRGVWTKIYDLFLTSAGFGIDAIFLTETGLDDSINSVQLFGSSFSFFRCDRNSFNSDKTGVLIALEQEEGSIWPLYTIHQANVETTAS